MSRINENNKQTILNLKIELLSDPKLKEIYNSIEIYDAILNKGITTAEEYIKYKLEHGEYQGEEIIF